MEQQNMLAVREYPDYNVLIYYIFEAFGRAFNKFIEITFQVD